MSGHKLFPASYSRLSTYEKCAAQAGYKYVMKLPTKKGPAATRGTGIHDGIEGYLLNTVAAPPVEAKRIWGVINEVKTKNPVVEHKIAFSRNFEKIVPWRDEEVWFRMVIDAAYPEGPTLYVQEWKSGKVYDTHSDQRKLYAFGSLLQWPEAEVARATTYYLDQGTKVTATVDRHHVTMLVGQFTERLERMENEKHWAPRPGNYCRWCDFSRYKGGPCRVG